jgi:hypothetical protein
MTAMLFPVSQEIRQSTAVLAKVMLNWPGVKMYRVFGTLAFYYHKTMFAILPEKRSAAGPHALSFQTSQKGEVAWDTLDLLTAEPGVILRTLEQSYLASKERPFLRPVFYGKRES